MKLRIELFGGIRLAYEGRTITSFRTQKTASLLGYLACGLGKPQRRDVLIDLFWPEGDAEASRNSLSTALWSLRQQLGSLGLPADVLLPADRAWVQLDPSRVATDLQEFQRELTLAEAAPKPEARLAHLETAVAAYRGDLLAGCYDDWALREQDRCRDRCRRALLVLIRAAAAGGDPEAALSYAEAASELDPLDQDTARLVIELHARNGRSDLALRHYRGLQRRLERELGVNPGARLAELVRLIAGRNGEAVSAPASGDANDREVGAVPLEGGAAPLNAPHYVARPVDDELRRAIDTSTSIVLLKGPRQTGKSSLLARGLGQARLQGSRVVLTDLQTLTSAQFSSLESFLKGLADTLAEQLGIIGYSSERWDADWSASLNLRHVLRTVLEASPGHVVWGLDEVDRLFPWPFAADVFGLFRSWHNERAFDPSSSWHRLTLLIAYATEAHLFVSDLNQSPFNVGTRLELGDFTAKEVAELDERCGSPLKGAESLQRFIELVGGQPYLAHRGLHEIRGGRTTLDELERQADAAPAFEDHLRRLLVALRRDPELCEAMRQVLRGKSCPSEEGFFRLRSAGLLRGDRPENARPRCRLYDLYLRRHLR